MSHRPVPSRGDGEQPRLRRARASLVKQQLFGGGLPLGLSLLLLGAREKGLVNHVWVQDIPV